MNTPTILPLLLITAILAGCGRPGVSKEPAPSSKATRNPLELTLAKALRDQIKIGPPRYAQVAGSLRVSGVVAADETRMAQVGAPVTGRITELDAMEGEPVKRGQSLATLYSTELSGAQFAFVKACTQNQLAQRAAARAKLLLNADVIGAAELQRREAELQQATAEMSSSKDQLRVLGMSDAAIQKLEAGRTVNSITHVVSSIDGTVLDRKVTIGQIVQPATTIFTVADLSHVWLVADIPEQSAGNIRVGKAVEAEIAALPGHTIRGRLTFVSAVVNPETRTIRTRMDLPNPLGRYKPAMLASMIIQDGAEKHLLIPSSAIVREDNQDYVFVQTGPDKLLMRPVTLGAEFDDSRVLTGGIDASQNIVLDGAFHLNNERKRLALQGE